MTRPYTVQPQETRFMSKVEFDTSGGCWLWTGSLSHNGYGIFAETRGPMRLAHRISYQMFRGSPDGKQVCHTCDVRCCVNPDHLWLGTPAENSADAKAKGRMTGAKNPKSGFESATSKLTPEIVRGIKASLGSGRSQRGTARDFGVGATTVRRIDSGEKYAHV